MTDTEYYARDWAVGRTLDEIEAEIARCEAKYLTTDYTDMPYGYNAEKDIVRILTLESIKMSF